ncbi:MAG: hypothetical protein ACOYN0_09170 [Phycisphaerales bacterium]
MDVQRTDNSTDRWDPAAEQIKSDQRARAASPKGRPSFAQLSGRLLSDRSGEGLESGFLSRLLGGTRAGENLPTPSTPGTRRTREDGSIIKARDSALEQAAASSREMASVKAATKPVRAQDLALPAEVGTGLRGKGLPPGAIDDSPVSPLPFDQLAGLGHHETVRSLESSGSGGLSDYNPQGLDRAEFEALVLGSAGGSDPSQPAPVAPFFIPAQPQPLTTDQDQRRSAGGTEAWERLVEFASVDHASNGDSRVRLAFGSDVMGGLAVEIRASSTSKVALDVTSLDGTLSPEDPRLEELTNRLRDAGVDVGDVRVAPAQTAGLQR